MGQMAFYWVIELLRIVLFKYERFTKESPRVIVNQANSVKVERFKIDKW